MGEIARLSIFPLAGALLFPRMQLPLHIFEPRYRALVSDAMARDRRILAAMARVLLATQPRLLNGVLTER